MHKIEIINTNIELNLPETAHEFSKSQLLSFSKYVFLYNQGLITFNELKVRLVYDFLNIKRTANLSDQKNEDILDSINQIAALTENYFYDQVVEGQAKKVIKMDFYMQKLPFIEVNGQSFYGPTDALFNTKYGEYLQLTILLKDYHDSNNPDLLDRLIATIYRPKKANYNKVKDATNFDGDIREVFNKNHTENYSKILKELPFNIKYAIYLYIASCQNFIATNNALNIGGGVTINLSSLFQPSESETDSGIGMIGTLYSLSETKVFGSIEEVANQNTYDVLTYLVHQSNEIKKLKSKNKRYAGAK